MSKLQWSWAWGASRNNEFIGVRLNDNTDGLTRARSIEWLHDMQKRGADLIALHSADDLADWKRNFPFRGFAALN